MDLSGTFLRFIPMLSLYHSILTAWLTFMVEGDERTIVPLPSWSASLFHFPNHMFQVECIYFIKSPVDNRGAISFEQLTSGSFKHPLKKNPYCFCMKPSCIAYKTKLRADRNDSGMLFDMWELVLSKSSSQHIVSDAANVLKILTAPSTQKHFGVIYGERWPLLYFDLL